MNSLSKTARTKLLLTFTLLLLCVACAQDAPPEMPPVLAPTQIVVAATEAAGAMPTATAIPVPTPTAIVVTESISQTTQSAFSLCQGGDLSAEIPFPTELTDRINPIISQLQARSPQASVSVAVQCGSGPLFAQAYGDASVEAGVAAQPGPAAWPSASATPSVRAREPNGR